MKETRTVGDTLKAQVPLRCWLGPRRNGLLCKLAQTSIAVKDPRSQSSIRKAMHSSIFTHILKDPWPLWKLSYKWKIFTSIFLPEESQKAPSTNWSHLQGLPSQYIFVSEFHFSLTNIIWYSFGSRSPMKNCGSQAERAQFLNNKSYSFLEIVSIYPCSSPST